MEPVVLEPELAQKIGWAVPFMFADLLQQKYFTQVFNRHPEIMQLHIDAGLWDKKDGKPDWANTSGHSGYVGARGRILTRMTGMSSYMQNAAEAAGLLHDIGKRNEVLYTKEHGRTWVSFEEANAAAEKFLLEAGVDLDLIRIAGACGHGSLLAMDTLLKKGPDELGPIDKLCLIVSFIDDYTVGTNPVSPVSEGKNALDLSIAANLAATNYALLNEEGKLRFDGKPTFVFQAEVAEAKQNVLARMVMDQSNTDFDPKRLPEMIEAELEKEMQAAA